MVACVPLSPGGGIELCLQRAGCQRCGPRSECPEKHKGLPPEAAAIWVLAEQ